MGTRRFGEADLEVAGGVPAFSMEDQPSRQKRKFRDSGENVAKVRNRNRKFGKRHRRRN